MRCYVGYITSADDEYYHWWCYQHRGRCPHWSASSPARPAIHFALEALALKTTWPAPPLLSLSFAFPNVKSLLHHNVPPSSFSKIILLRNLRNSEPKHPYVKLKYWVKNLCLSWDLNLRSPVLRTRDLTNLSSETHMRGLDINLILWEMCLKLSENVKFHANSAIPVLCLYNELWWYEIIYQGLKDGLILK